MKLASLASLQSLVGELAELSG